MKHYKIRKGSIMHYIVNIGGCVLGVAMVYMLLCFGFVM